MKNTSKASKYLHYNTILIHMANLPENKGTIVEDALLAGAAGLMSRYKKEKEEEQNNV